MLPQGPPSPLARYGAGSSSEPRSQLAAARMPALVGKALPGRRWAARWTLVRPERSPEMPGMSPLPCPELGAEAQRGPASG